MTQPSFFNQILIWPILNVLMFFYNILAASKIPGAFGLAIIFLTLFIRGLLYPLTKTQLMSAKKMSKLKPELDQLSKKHKGDRQKLQQVQLELYKKHGINPASGCLPLLLQMPVFIALYRVFWQVLGNGNVGQVVEDVNKIVYHSFLKIKSLDLYFFGINLGEKPANWQKAGWWLLLIPVITAGLQWYQTKLMTSQAKAKKEVVVKKKKKKKTEESPQQDMGQEMQKQMALMAPLMIGFVSFSFPVGLALYWNTFSLFGIIQSLRINER
ncbi:YidC/Oxa1 family membrane protein insertase [Candidatus Microgenomates bacterium]|nr:YidC/Oxa1 family membrane protein insertase [Candidatus Microgenomates bacterium]